MQEYQTKDLFDLFDGKEPATPVAEQCTQQITPSGDAEGVKNIEEQKKKKRRKPRQAKKNGVFALPVYKAAYDSYKECRFRFRKVPSDGKAIGREVTSNLKRIMVDIELVYWQVKPKTILPDTFALVLETMITIRAMKDFGDLSTKDFGIISQYTANLSKNMRVWSDFHNSSIAGNEKKNKVGDELNG